MKRLCRLAAVVPLLWLLSVGDPAQDPGDVLTVTRKTTKMRTQKRAFAPAVADLAEGDRLRLEKKEGAWYLVAFDSKSGFVHASDVSAKSDVRLSGEGVRESYSASEAAAARKGFNPQVEQEYRADNPRLEMAFQLLDRIQGREIDESDVLAFIQSGGLAGGGTE